jgi:predicted ATPase
VLKKLRLKDFKSFVDEQVELAPLTLLVGANASGKSNFLDAILFLHGLSLDLSLAEILDGQQSSASNAWRGLRGGALEAARVGTSSFAMESTWYALHWEEIVLGSDVYRAEVQPGGSLTVVSHQITCKTQANILLESESFMDSDGDSKVETGAVEDNKIKLPYPPFSGYHIGAAQKQHPPTSDQFMYVDAHKSVLPVFVRPRIRQLMRPDAPQDVLANAMSLLDALERVQFLDVNPGAMRGYGRRDLPLGTEAKNISGVLAQLCEDPNVRRSIVGWIAELCAPEVVDIDFIEQRELGDVMAIFVEKGGKRISARSISDGTLHFLGILLALRTAEPGSVILLEDMDTGLHPTRIRLLIEYLESVTRERDIQVVATTHSPVMLQWLKPESLRDVIVFGRVPEQEGTLMRRLGDIPHFEEVIQQTGIEELFSTGWLEMAL